MILVVALAGGFTSSLAAQSRVERELARLAQTAGGPGGLVGLTAVHLESGKSLNLEPNRAFPLASTYKIPIAVRLLSMVDKGQLKLDSLIQLGPRDIYVNTGGVIADRVRPGSALTIDNLLELMLVLSDNNATDILLRLVGGGAAVTARLREIGIQDIRVDRPTWTLLANWAGRSDVVPEHQISEKEFNALELPDNGPGIAEDAFLKDPRDHGSAAAMVTLLGKLWRREVLSEASTKHLFDIMYRCETGKLRLKGLLPPGTRVSHKTGTIGMSQNDVGIIDLPGDAGHVLIAVYTTLPGIADGPTREAVIGQLSRAVYDYFLLAQ